MKKTVKNTTLKSNLCINCGICKAVCPNNAILMKDNKYGETNPDINKKTCTNCGLCEKFCPNTPAKLKYEALKINNTTIPAGFGLEEATYYLSYNSNKEERLKSCSGGAVTKFASYLLEKNIINAMIHVERLWGHRGEKHYGVRISTTTEEIKNNVSSAYQTLDFSTALSQLEENKTYFITGTPCVIRGLKYLFSEHYKYKNINILTCALVCSHNTNAQFIDFLTEINELDDKKEWQVNIRQKDANNKDANNFNNHIYTKDKNLLLKNRHESGWTKIWRNNYFAMNVCLYCSDFWGYEADISIKDAWGKWSEDPLGKSIVIIRDKNLEKEFLKCGLINEIVEYDEVLSHQKASPIFKQEQAYNKNFKLILSKSNRRNKLLKFKIISYSSKFLYKYFGFKITKKIMKVIEFIANKGEKL